MNQTTTNDHSASMHEDARCAEWQVGICPYYIRDRGKGLVYCECARFRFPDLQARREILYRFCAHPTGYKSCMIKQCLDNYYERKYNDHDKETS